MFALSPITLIFGFAMILCNIGGRFLHLDYTKSQMEFLSKAYMRPIYVYSMALMSTRDPVQSLYVTLIYYTVIYLTRNV